ncbi:hypothetical protein ACIHFD_36090 [Nonomuraea sp. NPDC051941]|uniref:hypothetical protein n=1 Tax=Nonomuraea sp. NPDC051941 TaxID=3364373 RepID=UPI0037CA1B6A
MDARTAIDLIRRKAGNDAWAQLSASIAEDEALVVSGSLVEGIGNLRSDLDFFVLSEAHRPDVPVRMMFTGDSWLDIEYVEARTVRSLVHRIGTTDPQNSVEVLRISRPELDRYYRLAIGPTIKGTYSQESMFSLERFGAVLRSWAIIHAGAFSRRAAIALHHGDVTAAVLYAGHGAHLCAMGELTDVGELYPSPKYTFEKAARAYGRDSAEVKAFAVLLHPADDPEYYVRGVASHVDAVLAEFLPATHDDNMMAEPTHPIMYDSREHVSTLVTRKAAFDLLPEDTAAVAALLPAANSQAPSPAPSQAREADATFWAAEAHRLVIRQALLDAGVLKAVSGDAR